MLTARRVQNCSTVVLLWFYGGPISGSTVVLLWFYGGPVRWFYGGSTVVLRWFYDVDYL